MATAITLQQMLSRPMVRGAFSRVATAPSFFQDFFRMRPTDPATISGGLQRSFGYDIFSHTLTMAQARPPKIGPGRIPPMPIGQALVTICRFYEAIDFDYGDVYGMRGIGTMEMDARGESWVARQKLYMAARQINGLEFMISRMFIKAGFSITQSGESYVLGEKGAGTIDVTYPIPAANLNQLDGVIDASWALAGTKIIQQFLALNAVSERTTGLPIAHVFLNSVTFAHLLANTQLNTVRGTAMMMFNGYTAQTINTADGSRRRSGFTTSFPALPFVQFHVYDGVSVVSSQTDPETRTTANTTKYIPDGVALFTPDPDPGDWHGLATCGEPIREANENAPAQIVEGLFSFTRPKDDPPGEELRVLNNVSPILLKPGAIFVGTVVF